MPDSHLTAIAALATGRTRGRREVGLVSLTANNNLTWQRTQILHDTEKIATASIVRSDCSEVNKLTISYQGQKHWHGVKRQLIFFSAMKQNYIGYRVLKFLEMICSSFFYNENVSKSLITVPSNKSTLLIIYKTKRLAI